MATLVKIAAVVVACGATLLVGALSDGIDLEGRSEALPEA
jgi:hypothetical protein